LNLSAPASPEFDSILTEGALQFLALLQEKFGHRRNELLERRKKIQTQIDQGQLPDFLLETQKIRTSDWKIAPIPSDLQDRRVEITGPVDRKMVINALNSGARVYMADFEDSHSPTWNDTLQGQVNLFDAVRRNLTYRSEEGKNYSLGKKTAVLIVRPRGWHLDEKHALFKGTPMSASLFDFGLFFFHNAQEQIRQGTGPYFYLPKMESHLEARLWNEVFLFAQKELGLPTGTIKATVLIETILAAFEMDEILYELKEHIVGLNCGRWDYIFSCIKKFRNRPEFIYPERSQITMSTPFLKAYSQLLIQTCHRRGAHAMGGMAAQIPIKNNLKAHEAAMAAVRADKEREVKLGHDGTWVAHPGLVPLATEVFDAHMKDANQIQTERDPVKIRASDLLAVPRGTITEIGLRDNISVSLHYLEAWLRGSGCVPLHGLMEDAATAEIARAQVWQWIHQSKVTTQDVSKILEEEARKPEAQGGKFSEARRILQKIMLDDTFADFLTLVAYPELE